MKLRGEIYSDKYNTSNGRRTYFFNIKKNREGSLFLNLVESMKKFDGRFDRQEIVIYEEHIEEFRETFNRVIDEFVALKQDKNYNNDSSEQIDTDR